MGGRRTAHPGRMGSLGPPGAAAPAEEVKAHEEQLREVSARIEELLAEICLAEEDDPALPVLPCGEGPEDGEASEDSDHEAEIYERSAPKEKQRLAKKRLEKLLGRLNFDEREMALGEVKEWLQDRVGMARQDLNKLGRVDRDCTDRGAETAQAAKAVKEDLQRRGHSLIGSVHNFCSALSDMEVSKRNARRQKAARSLSASDRLSMSYRTNAKSNDHVFPMPTTDEELEVAVEDLRQRLEQAEAQALEELQQLQRTERSGKPSGEDSIADMEHGDLYFQQETMLCYLKEAIKENETRARLVREANDNLLGKVMLGEHGQVIPLSQEAMRIATALQEEVYDAVLPELLAQREAEHGEELQQPDEQRLNKSLAECQSLSKRVGIVTTLVEKLGDSAAMEDDISAQLRATDAGEIPQSTFLHDCSLALEECDDDFEDVSEADERLEEEQEPPSPPAPQRREREARNLALAALQESVKLHAKLLDVTENTKKVQVKLKAVEEDDSQAMRLLDILEEHRTLFNGALVVARHHPPPPPPLVPSPGKSRNSIEAAATEGSSEEMPKKPFRSFASVVNALAGARRAAGGLGMGKKQEEDDGSWAEHFKAEDGTGYSQEVLAKQAAALKAMEEEEKKLSHECGEMENTLALKIAEMKRLSEMQHGGVTPALAGHLAESVAAGREAIEAFARSISALQEVTLEPPPESDFCLTLEERREAVKEALANMPGGVADGGSAKVQPGGSAPSEARAAIGEASQLMDLSSECVKKLARIDTEIGSRRQARAKRRRLPLRNNQSSLEAMASEKESRALRQQTRALMAKRMEIAAAFSDLRTATAKALDQAALGPVEPVDKAAAEIGTIFESHESSAEAAAEIDTAVEGHNSSAEAVLSVDDLPPLRNSTDEVPPNVPHSEGTEMPHSEGTEVPPNVPHSEGMEMPHSEGTEVPPNVPHSEGTEMPHSEDTEASDGAP